MQNFITFSDGIFPYVLEMSCFKFQVSRMSGRSSMMIFRGGGGLRTRVVLTLCPRDVMFQISGL